VDRESLQPSGTRENSQREVSKLRPEVGVGIGQIPKLMCTGGRETTWRVWAMEVDLTKAQRVRREV
jgi:hypothetical protein